VNPRTTEILRYLDDHRAELDRAIDSVPPDLRETRPAPDRWSVAEIVEHVAIVEERIRKLLTGQVEAAKAAGPGAEHEARAVPTFDERRILDRSRKITAHESLLPRSGMSAAAARAKLAEQQEAMRDFVRSTDGLALEGVIVQNPVLGPLNIHQWMMFVAGHEVRHAEQIREAAAALRK
jgi:uncharacterized damage-inducible protein DinB